MLDPSYVGHNLTSFSYLGEMSSLLVHNYMTRAISHYMPALVELEVQPGAVLGYGGLTPDKVQELSDQLYTVLMSLVDGESFDIIVGAGSGKDSSPGGDSTEGGIP